MNRLGKTLSAMSFAPIVGRNSLCTCGSGIKFKKCCGNEAKKAVARAEEKKAWTESLARAADEREKKQQELRTANSDARTYYPHHRVSPLTMVAGLTAMLMADLPRNR